MKPIDQLVLDIALSLCAMGFCMVGFITGPGLGWVLFAMAVLLYALSRVLCALHQLVPGGFGFDEDGVIETGPPARSISDIVCQPHVAKELRRAFRDVH